MPFLYIIAGLLAVVWTAVFALRGSLVAGCLAYLTTAVCFGHPFWHQSVGPIPLTLDRLVLIVLVLCYVVQWRLGRTDPKRLGWADWSLLAFTGVLAFSTARLPWEGGVPGGPETVMRLLIGYITPVCLYWIARQSPLGERNVVLVQATLACLGVYLAVTGLLEVSGQWWAVFPKHIADPRLGIHFGRARGPMVHAVTFGLVLAVCLMAAWLWRARWNRLGQLAWIGVVPLLLAAIYLSYTRSVWMGTALGAMIVLGLTLRGQWRALVLGTMVTAGLLLALTRMEKLLSFEREYGAQYTRKSVDLRGGFAYVSWRMFLDQPVLGFGFNQFPEAMLPYLADRSTELELEAIRPYSHHCTFLSILTEAGIVGFVLFLAVLASWVCAAVRLLADPRTAPWARSHAVLLLAALGVYVVQAVFHELSFTPIDNSLLFLLAGITVGLSQAAGEADALAQTPGKPDLAQAA
ncbi:MAG: O-antigen ligase family protein [Patescibacteria group bacterium]|nr:O-antigen ligase family protein [Patescibacteria group bacterium]